MHVQYVIGQIMEGHASSVTAIAATYIVTTATLSTVVASASSDSTVMIWRRDDIAGNMNCMASLYAIYTIRALHTITYHPIWPRLHHGP